MSAPGAVFFDGDGTLWDFEALMRRALAVTLAHLRRVKPGEAAECLDVETMVKDRRVIERAAGTHGLRLEERRLAAFEATLMRIGLGSGELARDLNEVYFQERFRDVPLYPDVLPALRHLSASVKLGLLSNGNGYPEQSGLADYFSVCVFSDDHGVQKPDRRLYEAAAHAVEAEPASLVMVGDDLDADVLGALAAGWHAIWLNRASPRSSGRWCDYEEVGSLEEVPDALTKLGFIIAA